ncbi:MAG: ABC transporter ATP-binding protein, partial [Patescibacteria group bacterium]|nr:ABC transporter ATP-binding protein [Patescibacteria group bacterium]
AVSFSKSPLISIAIIVLSIPQSLANGGFVKKIWAFYNGTIEKRRKQYWIAGELTTERAIPQHKITRSDKFIFNLHFRIKKHLLTRVLKILNTRFLQSLLGTLIKSITYIITPLYLLDKIIKGTMTIGDFTFFEQKFIDFSWDIDSLLGDIVNSTDTASYITYVRHLFELKPVVISGTRKVKQDIPPLIEFKNVSFKYPRSNPYALKDINLKIEPGQEIAIVGENGAGKTTLIKLLLRFYDPTKGTILINGIPLQKVNLKSYYKLLSALFQEYNKYGELTVKENIYMGKTTQRMNMNKIRKAAKLADADKFINNLDHGYNQILNKRFSNGTNLSTGQWQKIALARMFYRDTPVLILDEPTASIDAVAEYKIFKRIYSFIKNKTVIIISHRFSTVRNAKKIYVLDKGKLVESGTHDKLLKLKGKYAEAFKLQAEGYQNQ